MVASIYIDQICQALGCSRRVLATLLGVTANTISANSEREVNELRPRTRDRLQALYFIVVKHLATVKAEARYEIIKRPAFEDLAGNLDSVVSALIQDKYDVPTLRHIATIAWNSYKDEELKSYVEIPGEADLSQENRAVA